MGFGEQEIDLDEGTLFVAITGAAAGTAALYGLWPTITWIIAGQAGVILALNSGLARFASTPPPMRKDGGFYKRSAGSILSHWMVYAVLSGLMGLAFSGFVSSIISLWLEVFLIVVVADLMIRYGPERIRRYEARWLGQGDEDANRSRTG